MKPLKNDRVVCCTDFSKSAAQAANAAAAIAARSNRRIALLYVADEFQAHAENEDELERFRERVSEKLTLEAERLRAAGVTVDEEMLHGTTVEKAILEWTTGHEAALLVVAAGRQRRWELGGTSERIAESASLPILVVRDAAPFEQWAEGNLALKIFVGTDFSVSSSTAIEWVAALRKLASCQITVAYVSWPPEAASPLGLHGPVPLVEQRPETERSKGYLPSGGAFQRRCRLHRQPHPAWSYGKDTRVRRVRRPQTIPTPRARCVASRALVL